jgi:hypothetical protein
VTSRLATEDQNMAKVVIQAVVSVDGYIAYPENTVGPLFDWYFNGDTELSARASGWTFLSRRRPPKRVLHLHFTVRRWPVRPPV